MLVIMTCLALWIDDRIDDRLRIDRRDVQFLQPGTGLVVALVAASDAGFWTSIVPWLLRMGL